MAMNERQVCLFNISRVKLTGERLVRAIISRVNECATRAFVQPVYAPRPETAARARQFPETVKQRVDECPFVLPRSSMHDHSSRFVYDDYIVVLVENGQRQILGRSFQGGQLTGTYFNAFSSTQHR